MNIDEIIREYIEANNAAKKAAKRAGALKDIILQHAGNDAYFETDVYSVTIKDTVSERLDTASLYRDFPDIKKDYGRQSVSRSVIPAARKQEKKSA